VLTISVRTVPIAPVYSAICCGIEEMRRAWRRHPLVPTCCKSVATLGAAGEPVRVTQNLPTRIAASGHVSSLAMGMWDRVDILKCSVLLHGPTERPTGDRRQWRGLT
jgi:hypothetical protein